MWPKHLLTLPACPVPEFNLPSSIESLQQFEVFVRDREEENVWSLNGEEFNPTEANEPSIFSQYIAFRKLGGYSRGKSVNFDEIEKMLKKVTHKSEWLKGVLHGITVERWVQELYSKLYDPTINMFELLHGHQGNLLEDLIQQVQVCRGTDGLAKSTLHEKDEFRIVLDDLATMINFLRAAVTHFRKSQQSSRAEDMIRHMQICLFNIQSVRKYPLDRFYYRWMNYKVFRPEWSESLWGLIDISNRTGFTVTPALE